MTMTLVPVQDTVDTKLFINPCHIIYAEESVNRPNTFYVALTGGRNISLDVENMTLLLKAIVAHTVFEELQKKLVGQ